MTVWASGDCRGTRRRKRLSRLARAATAEAGFVEMAERTRLTRCLAGRRARITRRHDRDSRAADERGLCLREDHQGLGANTVELHRVGPGL